MRHDLKKRLLSVSLSAAMLLSSPAAMLKTAAEDKPKYISEVYIAYGRTADDAKKWLTDHGWEPVDGNFNAGKLSYWDNNDDDKVASVMGIHRTANPNDAITDMAIMNMSGGYSFEDYKMIVEQKQAEIDAFIDSFKPVIEEYRANYNGKGSAGGKARAALAHDILNKFYDGEIVKEKDVHDTNMPIGDLLLTKTRRELGEAEYDKLPKNEQVKYGDLQQILLESTASAVLALEQTLALASDTAENTWLDRLSATSGVDLAETLELYIPETAGKQYSPSAAKTKLMETFSDAAANLAKDYNGIRQELDWYQTFMDSNGLWMNDGESAEDYDARYQAYFDDIKAEDEGNYNDLVQQCTTASILYATLETTRYEGEWGATLLDFFYPTDDSLSYQDNVEAFLPFAASLSKGQRSGLEFLSLQSLILMGANNEEAIKNVLPDFEEVFGETESISFYAGMNREIFRGGVALTSEAMMRKNMGKNPIDDAWYQSQALQITSYCLGVIGVLTFAAGARMYYIMSREVAHWTKCVKSCEHCISVWKDSTEWTATKLMVKQSNLAQNAGPLTGEWAFLNSHKVANLQKELESDLEHLYDFQNKLVERREDLAFTQSRALVGKVVMGIGAALMIATAAYKSYQLYTFYQRDFTPIPIMIVDEADIVTYLTDEKGKPILDENGNQKKNIHFDQYAYYQVVRCNRKEAGNLADRANGVSDYEGWGCGDAADLNCDCGKQWLALYTVKNSAKGKPILADSLTYQTGSDKMPVNCTRGLHYFCYDYAADLGDEAYAYNNKKDGIYFFWDEDQKAYMTASTFLTGQTALIGISGLALGILGTTIVMTAARKKKETPEAPAAA